LLVRARAAGDLERIFPTAKVTHTPAADYAYRTTLSRSDVAHALAAAVTAIDYPNFKDAVPEPDRHHAYDLTWLAMRAFQKHRARAAAAAAGDCATAKPPTHPRLRTSRPGGGLPA
jgi:hypothetical protein